MWLVVGLGNPGAKYALTRHNIGFMLVDVWVRELKASEKSEHKAQVFTATLSHPEHKTSQKVIFCKPQTFMNLSGDSVRALIDFYKIDPQQIVVAHDEIDQPFGQIKLQTQRGHGGHNGIRDIHLKLGHNNYYRLRMGVGRPSSATDDVADYVLHPFSSTEKKQLPDFLNLSITALESLIFKGYEKAATEFNGKKITDS